MDETQESLLKLMLTADIDQYERALAQHLAGRLDNVVFYPNSGRHEQVSTKLRSKKVSGHPMVKYQFVTPENVRYNVHMAFYRSGNFLAFLPLKAGMYGGSIFKLHGNDFYRTVRLDQTSMKSDVSIEIGSQAWNEVIDLLNGALTSFETGLPVKVDSMIAAYQEQEERAEVQRQKRTQKKALMKTGVFHKHNVRSTPATELLFNVVSRLGTEASVNKAFGELLPLITGELNDDIQS